MKLIRKQSVFTRLHSLAGALFATLLVSGSVVHGATYFSENFDTQLDTASLTNAGWQIDHNATAFETGTDFVLATYPYDAANYANDVWPPGNSRPPGSSYVDPLTGLPYRTPAGVNGIGSSLTNGGYLISDSDAAGGSDNIGSLSEFWVITPSFSTLGAYEVWWHSDTEIEVNNNGECIVTLDVSVDGGTTWVQAWAQAEPQRPIKGYNFSVSSGDPAYEGSAPIGGYPVMGSYSQTKTWSGIHGRWHVKLPAVANNKPDVKVRIRYYEPADAWYIALDNIVVDNKAPQTGSQVVLSENFANGIPATWKNLSPQQKWGTGPLTNLDGSLKMQRSATDDRKVHVDLLRYLDILRAEGTNLAPAIELNWNVTNFVDYPEHVNFHPQAPLDGYFLYMMAGGSYAMWQPDGTNHTSDLDTPTLDFSLKSEVFLDFDSEWLNRIYNAADPTLSQTYLVQVSVDGGANFTTIFDYQAALSDAGEGDYFMHHYIPVPQAAGKSNVVFRFHAEGRDNGNLLDPGDPDSGTRHLGFWVIDNVRITANSALSVQEPTDLVTTPSNTWYFLKMEGESFATKTAADNVGFTRAFAGDSRTDALGTPILADNTTASKKGALFTQTIFSQWADKATYYVQFARTGTYYLYMRFTMFENGGNLAHYLNEDSFFVPPDFDKDPQNDWPIPQPTPNGQSGGYTEGCCASAGYLFFPSVGDPTRVSFQSDTNLFEGNNFVWNDLISSQFLNPATMGEPAVHFKYEVTPAMLNRPLSFTIGYREGGTTIDMFLFSTSSNLMTTYTSTQLDQLVVNPMSVQQPTDTVTTPSNTWSYLKMEGESYASKTAGDAVGFTRAFAGDSRTDAYGTQILAPDTTASKGAALFTQTGFSLFADKATYYVQFARTGTYYMYMRFTMFDNAANGTYLNEDSFFLPPDFDKDPQFDWPITPPAGNSGGYTEGCCATAGWLFFPSVGDPTRVSLNDTNNFQGKFLWNDLISSQFLNPATQGDPSVRFKYEVTSTNVGVPLSFTIGSREGGLAIDMFLFSTSPDLMTTYTQAQLEQLFISAPLAITRISASGGNVTITWTGEATVRLQKTTTVANPASWADVPGTLGSNSHSEAVTATPTFYRLSRP